MTTTEQIVWAHRVDKRRRRSRPARRCACTPTCCRPRMAPRPSPSTRSTRSRAADTIFPRQAAIANDHFVFTGREDDDPADRASVGRSPRLTARAAVLRDAGRRHLSFLLSGAGAGDAGPVHSRRRLAQPRVRRVRRRRHRRGIDDAGIWVGDGLRVFHAARRPVASCSRARCSRG